MAAASSYPIRVVLLTRKGCCLCAEVKAVLDKVRGEIPFELDEVDIDAEPALRGEYGDQIPVVFVNGRKAFKYRVTEEALREKLRRCLAAG